MRTRLILMTALILLSVNAFAQDCYWVFLSDKNNTTFDPYSYFDAKAIERYRLNGADLNDISNYPLNSSYVDQIDQLATEEVGSSRWFNAIAVMATPTQILEIENLPFVVRTQMIQSSAQLASIQAQPTPRTTADYIPSDQLVRQQGSLFKAKGIDGRGIRIAVFDGGFPKVNTHEAFKHLRDNHQIIKTWNFCNKKEDVYGWSTHGTMVLSCIAGIRHDSIQLGLATGAEFLLARTEVDAEPFKEEVWWMQAMEWADKNGAQIISSSLGYGKERHYTTDMDGTSYVAKAANMAVRKGMVVCNSAGNEGDDKNWYTIITPADADSVICVGGIENDLIKYKHISFSSYGPTADGRMKPDLCNFGFANVASPKGDDQYEWVYGTSFSCPLTSGFVACAMQAHPKRTAMQMKREVIESCDLYPYTDYAFGHGVPQASYFTDSKKIAPRSFTIEDGGESIFIHFINPTPNATVFMNAELPNGRLERYVSLGINKLDANHTIAIHKSCLVNRKLNISCNGFYDSYTLSPEENRQMLDSMNFDNFSYAMIDTAGFTIWDIDENLNRATSDNYVNEHKGRLRPYFMMGNSLSTSASEEQFLTWSPTWTIGLRWTKPVTKTYTLGFDIEWKNLRYRTNPQLPAPSEYYHTDWSNTKVHTKTLIDNQFNIELFQRIRLVPTGSQLSSYSHGLHWDLGIFAGLNRYSQYLQYTATTNDSRSSSFEVSERARFSHTELPSFTYGITTRFTYNLIGIFARYTLPQLGRQGDMTDVHQHIDPLPRLEVGIHIGF